ncbi:MAG: hypothetical protein FRX49_01730 [Trebouxia sp. A1-2]|nr:MAG: hypothetical protein FRX49_01730 [Trebouxia sp. A1-2]
MIHKGSDDVPHAETAGSTNNTYSKEERAKLASIPESEMNPEMLRRWRISKANKGKQPWNKGRQHPPETLAKIRAGTKAAMLRPEVLAKVRANHPSGPHTPESKAKISAAVSASHHRRNAVKKARQALQSEGSSDQVSELTSASSGKAHTQEFPTQVARPPRVRHKAAKKAPADKFVTFDGISEAGSQDRGSTGKSASNSAEAPSPKSSTQKRVLAEQHRQNISLAIKQKWADPDYRMRTSCGMRSGLVQHKRVSTARVSLPGFLFSSRTVPLWLAQLAPEKTAERTSRAREQLLAARVRQEKLAEARRTVAALQSALEAGQTQAEALRGDPEGFARQQEILNDARALVKRAEEQVAQLVKNTPSLEQTLVVDKVAADLGARSVRGNDRLTPEEQEIDATAFVDEVSHHQPDAQLEQQQPFKVLSSSSEGQASSLGSISEQHDLARERAMQDGCVSVSHDVPGHIRHSYRHGRLLCDDNGPPSGTAGSAELQIA